MDNNIEEIDTLDDTIVFEVDNASSTKEINVIKEKNKVVDFTQPVETVKDDSSKNKGKKPCKKNDKKKKKLKFKLFTKIKDWWSGLSKIKKLVIGVITILVITLIVLLLIIFGGKKEKTKEDIQDVVFEQENYTYKNGSLIFIDENKNEIGKYTCKNKDEEKCYVAFKSYEDDFVGDLYLNQDGTKIANRASIINNNYVFIVDNKKGSNDDIILYSIKSKSNVDEFRLVKQSTVNKNMVVLKDKSGKYGVLNLTDENPATAVNFVYSYAGMLNNEMASKYVVIEKNGKNYIIDFDENLISSGFTNKIVDFNDNFIVTKSNDNVYKIYNYDGNELTPNNYLFIKIMGNYYAALTDGGLIVFDKDATKYNEVPIGLTSTNYNRTYVFDANKQLISNDVAFEMEVNEEYISITRGKAVDLLSMKEVEANKTIPYISYLNGVIYLYSNPEKTNLIGKYTCKNKNTAGVFDNCNIASSTNISKNDVTFDVESGIASILNNRYAFIQDSVSGSQIYLFDTSTSKKMGPYIEIEAYGFASNTYTEKDTDAAYVIVKNSKNQYGLLKIGKTSVDVIINFAYQELEKAGNNYIAKKSNGKFVIVNIEGKEISSEIDGRIMSYNDNYLAVKSNNSYHLYDIKGEKKDSKSYTYIKLYDSYYVSIVNNNSLEVREYSKPNEPVYFGEGVTISIKSSDSWKTANTFKVTASPSSYTVKIEDGENDNTYVSRDPGSIPVSNNTDQNNGGEGA